MRVLLLEEGTFSQDSQGPGPRPDWIVEQISTPRHDYRTWALPALTQQIYTEANPALSNRSGILLGPVVAGKALGGSTVSAWMSAVGRWTRVDTSHTLHHRWSTLGPTRARASTTLTGGGSRTGAARRCVPMWMAGGQCLSA